MEQVTLNVQGMSCEHCVKSVEESVGSLAGVSTVEVHLDTGTVDVSFDKDKIKIEQIKEKIEDQGYDV